MRILVLSEISQMKKEENHIYDFAPMWDMKLKAANEQDKPKLIDADNSIAVISRKAGRQEVVVVKY